MKRVWCVLMSVILFLSGIELSVQARTDEYLSYEGLNYTVINDGFAAISRYTGRDEKVIIPDEIDGHIVIHIEDIAFSGCQNITSVEVPESVTSIGWGAFRDCVNLVNINLPSTITKIGEYAFYNCANLETINLPDGISCI